MGTTSHGYPYPDPGDSFANGDDVIKALADAIDERLGRIASGSEQGAYTTANTNVTWPVTFPVGRFSSPPKVTLTPQTTLPETTSVSVSAVTAAGFNLHFRRTSAAAIPVHWIAHQE